MKTPSIAFFALLFGLPPGLDLPAATADDPRGPLAERLGTLSHLPQPAGPAGMSFVRRDYPEHSAVEWQVRLRTPPDGASPLYTNLLSADFVVRFPVGQVVTLHWNSGSRAESSDFQPHVEALEPGRVRTLESFGGRSSDGAMPYFNLAAVWWWPWGGRGIGGRLSRRGPQGAFGSPRECSGLASGCEPARKSACPPCWQGNPQPDPQRFPRGLGPVGEAVRETGMRFLVWFEPERAMRGTWLTREHPGWLLRPGGTPPALGYQERDGFHLLDLGDAEARTWAIESVSKEIRHSGIAVYRQDCNLYPGFFWSHGEAADEVGLREVRYVSGLYAFLDELVRRQPGLILDHCASGGRRLDFEMMRRCVALWRSDSCWDAKTFPRNVQAMTHGLSLWLPLHGLGAAATGETALRSGMGACAAYAINYSDPLAVSALRRHLDRYLRVRPLFLKEFYPLTP